jgi:hypothetical protein
MKRRNHSGIESVQLRNAVLCGECECITEAFSDTCTVCGAHSLVHLGRLLKSVGQEQAGRVRAVRPAIGREMQKTAEPADALVPAAPDLLRPVIAH